MEKLQHFCLQISGIIKSGIEEYLSQFPEDEDTQINDEGDTIYKCGLPILNLLWRQARILCQRQGDWALLQRRLDDLISLAKGKFYAYPFKDVPECWRRLFTDASLLKVCSVAIKSGPTTVQWQEVYVNSINKESDMIDIMVQTLDLAIIMAGAPGMDRRVWIEKIMNLLEPICEPLSASKEQRPSKRRKIGSIAEIHHFPDPVAFVPQVHHPIGRAILPSFEEFEKYMADPHDPQVGPRPLIIENVMEYWPARNERPWRRPSYLLSKTLNGRRIVPIEVGRSYVDDGWGQKIIPFKDFMNDHLLQSPGKNHSSILSALPDVTPSCDGEENDSTRDSRTGYLAQHDLFTQIPSLRADISIPDYCFTSASPPHPSSPLASKHGAMPLLVVPQLNAWLGPSGTISPMHVDPYHNILAQVVGRKYVRLYAPRESAKLYARGIEDGGVDMCNTSALDIGVLEGWDGTKEDREEAHRKYPLYSGTEYVDTILEEGECLYIPLGWWHYVRSLSVSFSVSFWWN